MSYHGGAYDVHRFRGGFALWRALLLMCMGVSLMPARHRTELSCWVRAWIRGPVGSMGPCGDRGEVDGRWMEMVAMGGGDTDWRGGWGELGWLT